jgi:CheY-like chemotaxis protein
VKTRVKVLVVDNDILKVKAICEALRWRFQLPTVWMARNAQEAIEILSQEMPWDLVFLDYDLETSGGLEAGNGQTVAMAMCEIGVKAQKVIIQSMNAYGAKAITGILNLRYRVLQAPFPQTLEAIGAMQ